MTQPVTTSAACAVARAVEQRSSCLVLRKCLALAAILRIKHKASLLAKKRTWGGRGRPRARHWSALNGPGGRCGGWLRRTPWRNSPEGVWGQRETGPSAPPLQRTSCCNSGSHSHWSSAAATTSASAEDSTSDVHEGSRCQSLVCVSPHHAAATYIAPAAGHLTVWRELRALAA